MSLATDSIFVDALKSNATLVESVGDRIYGTAIPLPDEDADNVPVPYLIVTFDGLNNDTGTKDDRYESEYDKVNIGIEVVGRTLKDLHDLTQMVRHHPDVFPCDSYERRRLHLHSRRDPVRFAEALLLADAPLSV